ncbi:hypothetical protein CC80DRAFT_409404 [Byssothecium circinans]|uniref:40S ribosomal protein S12 n=1 Tax=Byssothecium circinans TaxID=147558 RepID=A0A6A5UBA7_9PLEO|nr:hypothetical protein CC80DRAFT_409404 [Byssothecium circinans]
MAVASSAKPLQQLTPPGSSHGGAGSWDFAVPVDPSKNSYPNYEPFMNDDIASAHPYSPREPFAAQTNGILKPSRSNTLDSQGQYYEDPPGYRVPSRVNELHKQTSGDLNASGSDPDGASEYYKTSNTRADSRNRANAKGGVRKKSSKKLPPNWGEAESNENNWIHRDKLKEIETRELEAAGFRVGRSSRSNSRSQSASARHMSRDRTNSEATEPTTNGDHHVEPRRNIFPVPAEGEEEEAQQTGWDIRSPEEIAADREEYAARNDQVIRPSTSRIPVAKTSPLPVPNTFVERDQPLPRQRNGSGNWDADALATIGARVRSGSVSSQFLLDEPRSLDAPPRSPTKGKPPVSPATNAPPLKAKMPGKPAPTSGARKVTPKGGTKPRKASNNSPIKRPGTSGGSISRPGTSHRPEGEAPWVATMYKPDPMLPPDQQIIPTHAKRMWQEQWENEGRVASVYDKDFRMLKPDDFPDKRASTVSPIDIEKAQAEGQWPLPSPDKLAPVTSNNNFDPTPKSPVSEAGSYKLTPTIPQSPRAPSRNSERRTGPAIDPLPVNTTRLPEPPAETEKDKAKEKKACCCISDGEDNASVAAAEEVEVSADASAGKGQMSVLEALKGVLKLALIHDGLARGLREASKALDRRQAHMCVLNEACEEEAYKKLVVALCSEHKIPLIKVPDGKQLGEWAGLCQLDREGNARKIVNCSCVVVRDWGEESQERSILLNYFQTEQ